MSFGLEALAEVVAPSVLVDAIESSRQLASLGIPHALIGGLAVGLHGHPRATRDVDFLVGDEAFEQIAPSALFRKELVEIARAGVIDFMGVPPQHRELRSVLAVPKGGEIPVVPVPALVLLKLLAGRPQDLADVHALLKAGADVLEIRTYLGEHAPQLVPELAKLLDPIAEE
ncbi:nucleotidyl transferase AbiEii/AbiGii toxin family protein [Candidatus Fermentibacteria bacterium]|nr:nucleotidyl transferase AbiEii/AbiGii toxin family protein [Candidatus Fermentibacteria bacterium]